MSVGEDRLKEHFFLYYAQDALTSSTDCLAVPADCEVQEGLDELELDLNSTVSTRLGMQPSRAGVAFALLLRKITEQFQYDFRSTRSLREYAVNSILAMKMQTAVELLQQCWYCGTFQGLRRCGACRFTAYCSERCAKLDWPTHKGICGGAAQLKAKITIKDVILFF